MFEMKNIMGEINNTLDIVEEQTIKYEGITIKTIKIKHRGK